jgi:hypothetical protein
VIDIAGAFGYKFIFFSVIFYLFLGFILTMGAGSWLSASIHSTAYTIGNYSTNVTEVNPTATDWIPYIFQNPLSGISFLAWLSLGILITDIYIVVTSLIP